MRFAAPVLKYPMLFAAGWLFNFVYDTRFVSGFLTGWLSHGWIGELLR